MRDLKPFPNRRDSQRGFTLLEVLIGVIVVSVGMLTVAGLQMASVKSNFDGIQRTTATLLAQDLASRMRTNRGELATFLVQPSQPLGGKASPPTEPTPNCSSAVNACNAFQLARHDLWLWEQALDGAAETVTEAGTPRQTGGLVAPSACVDGPPGGTGGLYRIVIAWRGVSPISSTPAAGLPTALDCGKGSGRYGDDDEYRRVLVLQVFIV